MPQLCPIRWNLFLVFSSMTTFLLLAYFSFTSFLTGSKESKECMSMGMLFSGFSYLW